MGICQFLLFPLDCLVTFSCCGMLIKEMKLGFCLFFASGNHSYGVLFLLFFCSSAQRKIEAIVRNYYTNWIMRIKQIRQFGPHEPVRAIISHLYVNQRCFSYLSNALRVFSCQHHNSGGQFLLQS